MKLDMQKVALIIISGVFLLSGILGAAEDSVGDKKIEAGQNEGTRLNIPKFNKIRMINEVIGYEASVFLNESLPDPGSAAKFYEAHATKNKREVLITIPGEAWYMYSLRLVLKDKTNELDSGEKVVDWDSARDKEAEIVNIFGEKLEGVDVIMKMDKDLLVMTIKQNEGVAKKAEKESTSESRYATF